MSNIQKIRLQKILADYGIASRRHAEKLIEQGLVKVNGLVAKIGDKADPIRDKIIVQGKKRLSLMKKKYYYIMLNKPRGYITTMNDERNRKCVADLIRDIPARLFPIGRLDRESEGLLFFTNDGAFAHQLMHPSHQVDKVYRVSVKPSVSKQQLEIIQRGMDIDGQTTAPAKVHVVHELEDRCILDISIHEGRNRQIRKMFEALNLEVSRLKRISIGPVQLGTLPPGKWRFLKDDELKALSFSPNHQEYPIKKGIR